MSATFKQTGDAVDYTPGADVAAGDVVVQGELVGIAKLDIPAGSLGALAVVGVFDLPKATGAAMTAGALVYWDEANQVTTTDAASGANKLLGKVTADAVDTATVLRVRLSQ